MSRTECRCVICHDYGDSSEWHPADQRLVDNIGDRGWGVLAIPASDANGPWAFTAGLWHSFRVPEVALFGIPPESAIPILNLVGDQVAAGRSLTVDQRLDDVLTDYQVALRPVTDSWRGALFGRAMWFYRSALEWPVLQCVWPDREHHFPDDSGFAVQFEGMQPRLDLAPHEHPDGVWTAWYTEWLEWSQDDQ